MRKLLILLALAGSAFADDGPVEAAWLQYGPDGALSARAAVHEACPALTADGVPVPMQVRAAADGAFPSVCEGKLPAGTRVAMLADRPLPPPASDPQRILVIGDGGCRVKGGLVQDCRDQSVWPFARIAASAATLKPDLVLHVGDYPSREGKCPEGNRICEGQPFGDNWTVWKADLFAPLAPLLAVAPVVFTRGNHEECARTGAGFMRLLGPYPFDAAVPCMPHLPPFSVPFKHLNVVVMDDAYADEQRPDPAKIATLREELAALSRSPAPTWLMLHRPIFGSLSGPLGVKVGGNVNLIEALPEAGLAASVALMLSGHFHTFETLNYAKSRKHMPPQLIAGIGGDLLSEVPQNPVGTVFQGHSGVEIASGTSASLHGFVLMTKLAAGWRIERFDADGGRLQTCLLAAGRIACPG